MFIAMIFWGIAWPVGKIAAAHSAPEVAAFWRYTVSLVSFIPVLLVFKPSLKTDKDALLITVLAGVLTAVFNWLFFAGLTHGLAGYGGTIVTTMAPVLTYALSVVIFKTSIQKMQAVGIGVGLLGGVVLLKLPYAAEKLLNIGVLYFVIAALIWSLVTLSTQRAVKKINVMLFTLIVFGITAFINLLFALPLHPFNVSHFDSAFWRASCLSASLPEHSAQRFIFYPPVSSARISPRSIFSSYHWAHRYPATSSLRKNRSFRPSSAACWPLVRCLFLTSWPRINTVSLQQIIALIKLCNNSMCYNNF